MLFNAVCQETASVKVSKPETKTTCVVDFDVSCCPHIKISDHYLMEDCLEAWQHKTIFIYK